MGVMHEVVKGAGATVGASRVASRWEALEESGRREQRGHLDVDLGTYRALGAGQALGTGQRVECTHETTKTTGGRAGGPGHDYSR